MRERGTVPTLERKAFACLHVSEQRFRGCYSVGTPPSEAVTELSSQITVLSSQSCPLDGVSIRGISRSSSLPIKALMGGRYHGE